MTKYFLFLVLTTTLSAQVISWEWQNSKPAGNSWNDVVHLGGSTYILFGDYSTVARTTDGGATFTVYYPDSAKSRRNIYEADFVSPTVGYACGTSGLIIKTTDGGITWDTVGVASTATYWYLDFIDADTGYVGGSTGKLLKTTNGGVSWTEIPLGSTSAVVYRIFMVNAQVGYIGTGSATPGRILKTTDYGATWVNQSSYTTATTVRGMWFLNADTGFVGTTGYTIAKTTDGGATWNEVDFGSGTFYDIKFRNSQVGVAAGADGVVYRTTDGGATWTPSQTEFLKTANVYGICLNNNYGEFAELGSPEETNDVWICTEGGAIAKSTNDGATWTSVGASLTREDLRGIHYVSDNIAYAIGGSGTTTDSLGVILKTTNGGMDWSLLPFNPKFRLYAQAWIDANTGFVANRGPDGIFKTTDGGNTFTQINTGYGSSTAIWYDIKFANANVGYAGNGTGVNLIKTTDGGATWIDLPDGHGTTAIYALWVFDSLTVISTGSGGKTFKTTDGGLTWTNLATSSTTMYAIHFVNRDVGFLVGSAGRAYKTTDGGTTWTLLTTNSTATLYSVRFFNESVGFIGGSSGEFLYTTDGGNTWVRSKSFPSNATTYSLNIRGGFLSSAGTRGNIVRGNINPIIPVELTSFSASVTGSGVTLFWSTATETNNSGFEIQRLDNGNWNSIGFVNGAGTTTETQRYSFTDNSPLYGRISYRLKQIDFNGTFEYSSVISADVSAVTEYSLQQNYPNPFNPSTTVEFGVPVRTLVAISLYNLLGEKVATVLNTVMDAGRHQVKIDASALPAGIYLYEIQTPEFRQVRKMTLIK